MNGNLGDTELRRQRRLGNPMARYDALPKPLRNWLSHAALPWSPWSAARIWTKARAEGLSTQEALYRLARAEASTLERAKRQQIQTH